jgi:hypothetical protein
MGEVFTRWRESITTGIKLPSIGSWKGDPEPMGRLARVSQAVDLILRGRIKPADPLNPYNLREGGSSDHPSLEQGPMPSPAKDSCGSREAQAPRILQMTGRITAAIPLHGRGESVSSAAIRATKCRRSAFIQPVLMPVLASKAP